MSSHSSRRAISRRAPRRSSVREEGARCDVNDKLLEEAVERHRPGAAHRGGLCTKVDSRKRCVHSSITGCARRVADDENSGNSADPEMVVFERIAAREPARRVRSRRNARTWSRRGKHRPLSTRAASACQRWIRNGRQAMLARELHQCGCVAAMVCGGDEALPGQLVGAESWQSATAGT